jgi:hypothetical protein
MKRTTKYVALDIHQATTVAAVREQSGRVIARCTLPTEAGAIVEFFQGMRGSVRVTFEEGTQAQWLHDLLTPVVDQIVVCDRRGEHRGHKADQLDADKLSHRLLSGDLRAVYHGSSDRLTLQELTRTYMNLLVLTGSIRGSPASCNPANLAKAQIPNIHAPSAAMPIDVPATTSSPKPANGPDPDAC